jgi:hypothetical protein
MLDSQPKHHDLLRMKLSPQDPFTVQTGVYTVPAEMKSNHPNPARG